MPLADTRNLPSTNAWRIMNPVRGQIHFAMALSVLAALAGLAAMGLLALTVRQIMAHPGNWPWLPGLGVLTCTVLAYLLRLTAFDQSHYAAFRLEALLRQQLSGHLARVSMGYIESIGAAALAKVIHDDVKALHVFVADSTPLYARAYVTPLLTLIALLWLDWRLALGALAVLVVGLGGLGLAMRNRQEMARRYNEAREQVSAAVVEYVQAMPVVRIFDSGQATFGRYQQALETYLAMLGHWYRKAGFPARFSMALLNPLPTLLVLLWLGAWLNWHQALDFSTWLAVLLVGTGMAEAMLPAMSLSHMVDKVKLSITRIDQILAAPVLPAAARPERPPADTGIEFERVCFRYAADADAALSEVSFRVPPGSVTALVGPSGAGKSTVARLIPRFWDVAAGSIRIGGVDVRDLDDDALLRQVAFVFQDTFLFADSIAANIRLGMPEADMAAVVAAARAAQAHDFITALPQGYATLAGERGTFLSGGQRQRITIARAILQNRPILVLDEATAFADPENEAALIAALSELMRGKTVIMVAHRLDTIRDADQILVFERGRLSESGQHQTLLDAGGVYARLWHSHEQARRWTIAPEGRHVAVNGRPNGQTA